MDELCCHLGINLPYANAKGGARVKMPQPFIRDTKITMLGAISTEKVEAAIYGEWSTDSEIFTVYVEQQLVPILSEGKVVIMDNVRFHDSKQVKKLIESTGACIKGILHYPRNDIFPNLLRNCHSQRQLLYSY